MVSKNKQMPKEVSKYPGEWVVVFNNKLIAHTTNAKTLREAIHSCDGTPTVMLVPSGKILLY